MDNNKNYLLFAVISILIVVGFRFVFPAPVQHPAITSSATPAPIAPANTPVYTPATLAAALRERGEVIKDSARIPLHTPELSGSINLKGARLDDLVLTQYRETTDPTSPNVVLLSPTGSAAPNNAHYADFSWLADSKDVAVPTADSVWTTSSKELTPEHPLKLQWKNNQGLIFEREIAVDDHSMFTLTDHVTNLGATAVTLYPFGLVARQGDPVASSSRVLFEGALGVIDGTLEEFKYKNLIDNGKKSMDSQGGWVGITSKYWLVAIAPPADEKLTTDFVYDGTGASNPEQGRFQTDYRGSAVTLADGANTTHVVHMFAGAKKISLLDTYANQYDIKHLDRAIDFGWFYFLTKPFLYMLSFLGKSLGSLGIAILVFTVMLKLITLPLSIKSNHSMARMKALQPEVNRLKERYAEDKMRQNQEVMELFKREKVSPMSGCLPTVIQIPIFFALYKVLYIGIEMRQAPFFGWIHDMASPDPTSWFNLFGLAPWHLPEQIATSFGPIMIYLPPALHIGIWPILMGFSMLLQQRLSPQTMDKSQAQMFKLMPIIFTYMLSTMPAGLVIYWTWSNLLSVAQQWFIMNRDAKTKGAV